jgi:hypothetical protein
MSKSKTYYRKKADRLFQEIGRKKYDKCLVCGNPVSCLHRYFPKSSAGNLRYSEANGTPCVKVVISVIITDFQKFRTQLILKWVLIG